MDMFRRPVLATPPWSRRTPTPPAPPAPPPAPIILSDLAPVERMPGQDVAVYFMQVVITLLQNNIFRGQRRLQLEGDAFRTTVPWDDDNLEVYACMFAAIFDFDTMAPPLRGYWTLQEEIEMSNIKMNLLANINPTGIFSIPLFDIFWNNCMIRGVRAKQYHEITFLSLTLEIPDIGIFEITLSWDAFYKSELNSTLLSFNSGKLFGLHI